MRRGFLSSAPDERVALSSKIGALAHHVGIVVKREDADGGERVTIMLADGKKRVLPSSEVRALRSVDGDRVLVLAVNTSAWVVSRLLSSWSIQAPTADTPAAFLPPEVVEHVLSFLEVPRVKMPGVRAVAASSIGDSTGGCSLENSLDPSPNNWWISGHRSVEGGLGAEWVCFCLGGAQATASDEEPADVSDRHGGNDDDTQPLASTIPGPLESFRVERISICIPPLPSGPLSVRELHLEAASQPEGPWERCSGTLTTLDTDARQTLQLSPPVEAACVRVVCTKNAARAAFDTQRAVMARRGLINLEDERDEDREFALRQVPSSIGYFSVEFC
jgi:hypothetical protein